MPTVLITGANRGIGLALAAAYRADGWTVIATARVPENADALMTLGSKDKSGLEVLALDVSAPASVDRLSAAMSGRSLDLAVLNAGIYGGGRGALDDPANTPEAWAQVLATNVTGVFFTARAVLPAVARAKGKVAIISSRMGSSTAVAGASYLYRASKAAAANVGANLAVELKPKGVAVGIYHPGWVRTDMGGPGADISVEESATGLKARFAALSLTTTGVFEDYAGRPIAY